MNGITPECPVCRVRMEEGFIPEVGGNNRLQRLSWTEGVPEKGGMFGFKLKGKRRYATVSYRCPRCGWLVWFAPEANDEG